LKNISLYVFPQKAVHELTSKGDVVVMLPPDSAAKLKHYYGVDNDKIQLFDPNTKPHPRNLDKLQSVYKDDFDSNIPDLVCTLGGDGLLMYASNLFPGPCPPILCVAGGSLGFLTPFRRDEMVDCIRKSLGLKVETDDDQFYYDGHGESNSWYDDYAPEVPPYMASRMKPSYVDEDGITWTGSYRVPRDDPEESRKKKQTKFGSNNQIYISTRMRLECLVINREGVVRAKYNVLNEVVIDRGSSPYLAALECFCDNVHLTTVQADGIIFST
jgi:NAD kinase